MERHTFPVRMSDGGYIHVDTFGHPGDKATMLIHGAGNNSSSWFKNLPKASNRFFIIPTMRGFGAAGTAKITSEHCAIDIHSDDINSIIQHFIQKDETVDICAVSFGSYSSMGYLHKYGVDKVSSFLSVDQSAKSTNDSEWKNGLYGKIQDELYPWFNTAIEKGATFLDLPFDKLPSDFRELYLAQLATFFSRACHKKYQRLAVHKGVTYSVSPMLNMFNARNWQSYYHITRSFVNSKHDFRKTMSEIEIPITAYIGIHSETYPVAGQYDLVERAKHGFYLPFDDGHSLFHTSSKKFKRCFNEYLSNIHYESAVA